MQEKQNLRGVFTIECRAPDGRLLGREVVKNQLTAINQTVRTQMLLGTYTGALDALQIKYFALGTGTTPATVNDTQLVAEVLRKPLTQLSNPAPGQVVSVVAFGAAEANFNIREIGVFGGADATSEANSGTLLARVVVNVTKNDNILLNITRTDICTI